MIFGLGSTGKRENGNSNLDAAHQPSRIILSQEKHDIVALLELFEERLKSFEKMIKRYPRRRASLPLIQMPTIEAAYNELDELRKKLSELTGSMNSGQAKNFGKSARKHDDLKVEYVIRKPVKQGTLRERIGILASLDRWK
jgi:hypothetical protein